MNSYSKYIESAIMEVQENKIIDANKMYHRLFEEIPETSYYKTLERMSKKGSLIHLTKGLYYRPKKSRFGIIPISEQEIISHYTDNGRGIVIGYRLFNEKGLTTQVSKRVEVLSSAIIGQKKNINNVCVMNSGVLITEESAPIIETMEILQNFETIEDLNKSALAEYMRKFAAMYSDSLTVSVLRGRKYKKSTIALLNSFLNYHGIKNTLNQFLSVLSTYSIPSMEEFYESA